MRMTKRKKAGGKIVTILLVAVMLAGLSLLLYPTVASWWNKRVQTTVSTDYGQIVNTLSNEDYTALLEEARAYNRDWAAEFSGDMHPGPEQMARYERALNTPGTDVMATIEIPQLSVFLAVYHGSSEAVLRAGVGHLEWSALPVGGEGTHCVLSGHRGLPSSRLFTDLPQLMEGDFFILHVLNEMYTYEVDQILIVLPHETEALMPEAGEDLCTLVTCTPYGVNSHRLLVRGHRVPNEIAMDAGRIEANAVQVSPYIVALFLGVPVVAVLFAIAMITGGRRGKERRNRIDEIE